MRIFLGFVEVGSMIFFKFLEQELKISDMRFATQRLLSRTVVKAELVFNSCSKNLKKIILP